MLSKIEVHWFFKITSCILQMRIDGSFLLSTQWYQSTTNSSSRVNKSTIDLVCHSDHQTLKWVIGYWGYHSSPGWFTWRGQGSTSMSVAERFTLSLLSSSSNIDGTVSCSMVSTGTPTGQYPPGRSIAERYWTLVRQWKHLLLQVECKKLVYFIHIVPTQLNNLPKEYSTSSRGSYP